jgi:hypothetical protein
VGVPAVEAGDLPVRSKAAPKTGLFHKEGQALEKPVLEGVIGGIEDEDFRKPVPAKELIAGIPPVLLGIGQDKPWVRGDGPGRKGPGLSGGEDKEKGLRPGLKDQGIGLRGQGSGGEAELRRSGNGEGLETAPRGVKTQGRGGLQDDKNPGASPRAEIPGRVDHEALPPRFPVDEGTEGGDSGLGKAEPAGFEA